MSDQDAMVAAEADHTGATVVGAIGDASGTVAAGADDKTAKAVTEAAKQAG